LQRRSVQEEHAHGEFVLEHIINSHAHHSRQKRQGVEFVNTVNNHEREFYLGFYLDGVLDYQDVSTALPGYEEFILYESPTFEYFENDILVFKTYSPHNHLEIDIFVSLLCDTKGIITQVIIEILAEK